MKTKKWHYIFFVMVAALIISSFFWGSPGQSRNMRQVGEEIQKLKEKLEGDVRFSEVLFLTSTANMGKNLYIDGTVADEACLEELKKLIESDVAVKFSIVYQVEVEGVKK